jgi:hypothetical protein
MQFGIRLMVEIDKPVNEGLSTGKEQAGIETQHQQARSR